MTPDANYCVVLWCMNYAPDVTLILYNMNLHNYCTRRFEYHIFNSTYIIDMLPR